MIDARSVIDKCRYSEKLALYDSFTKSTEVLIVTNSSWDEFHFEVSVLCHNIPSTRFIFIYTTLFEVVLFNSLKTCLEVEHLNAVTQQVLERATLIYYFELQNLDSGV